MVRRKGFTLIELVFAIVVISVVVLAIPTMNAVTNKTMEGSVKQETIFAASAKMIQVLSYPWDENSIITSTAASRQTSRVVDIPGDNFGRFDVNGTADNNSNYRKGQIRSGLHRRFSTYNAARTKVSSLGDDNATLVGMEEQSGAFSFTYAGLASAGMKDIDDRYVGDVKIGYLANDKLTGSNFVFSQSLSNTPSNVKVVRVAIGNSDGDITALYAYSANIGEVDYERRTY